MGEVNSDDHYIYYCGQESLRKNGIAIIVNKRVWNAVLGCNLKKDRMISVHFQGKPFNITVIQVYIPASNAKGAEWSWTVLWSTRPSRANTQKRCPFHYRQLECKSRKSRNTWSNRQIWVRSAEWSRAKAIKVLPTECTGHSKHPVPIIREDSTHGHHRMEIGLIIFFAAKDGKALYSQWKQDQELTVAQIMNSLFPNSDLNWRK